MASEGKRQTLLEKRKMAGVVYNLTPWLQTQISDNEDSCSYPIDDTSTAQYSCDPVSSEGPQNCFDSFDELSEAPFQVKSPLLLPIKADFGPSTSSFQSYPQSDPLKQVTRFNNRCPKKAYFRIQLIRGFKKSLRQITTRRWAKAGIFQLDKSNPTHREMWADYYKRYRELKPAIKETTRMEIYNSVEKSYNNAYCKRFFGDEAARKLYFWFSGLVFWPGMKAEESCKKFKFRCCDREEHTEECEAVWAGVKQCAQYGLFKDFGLSPWNGSQWVSSEEVDTGLLLSLP